MSVEITKSTDYGLFTPIDSDVAEEMSQFVEDFFNNSDTSLIHVLNHQNKFQVENPHIYNFATRQSVVHNSCQAYFFGFITYYTAASKCRQVLPEIQPQILKTYKKDLKDSRDKTGHTEIRYRKMDKVTTQKKMSQANDPAIRILETGIHNMSPIESTSFEAGFSEAANIIRTFDEIQRLQAIYSNS